MNSVINCRKTVSTKKASKSKAKPFRKSSTTIKKNKKVNKRAKRQRKRSVDSAPGNDQLLVPTEVNGAGASNNEITTVSILLLSLAFDLWWT